VQGSLLVAVICSSFALPTPPRARAQEVRPTLDTIFQAWKERRERTRSFAFEWEQTFRLRGSLLNDDLNASMSPSTEGDEMATLALRFELYVDGERFDYRLIGNDALGRNRTAFDGAVTKSLTQSAQGAPGGKVAPGAGEHLRVDIDPRPLLLAYRAWPPENVGIRREQFTLSDRRGTVDGRECLIMEHVTQNSRVARYWVDPGRDYLIVRVEGVGEGKGGFREDFEHSFDPEHGWVPSGWTMTWVDADGALKMSKRSRVTKWSLNEPVAPERFDFSFPSGTFVTDEVRNIEYMQDAETSVLKGRWQLWVGVSVAAVLVAAMAFGTWIWRRTSAR
jgi:hypothetical protein